MLLFVDNLTNVDFSYLDAERGILGETWLANIVLHGELDTTGMVCDFGTVKKTMRNWLDGEIDHRLAVPTLSPNVTIDEAGDYLTIKFEYGSKGEVLETRGPKQAFALVSAETITPESTAAWCIEQLKTYFPDSIEQLELTFTQESIEGAQYHYSHGLKKHLGNCQRICHGHRSRLDIWENGKKSPDLENYWADLWRDIYIGTEEDISGQMSQGGIDYWLFNYTANQGDFSLRIPKAHCYIMSTDTTVELIATHIAQSLRRYRESQGARDLTIRVKAYEGIGKGAVSEAVSD